MSDVFSRLTAALADRYRFARDGRGGPAMLGEGGMASVYLARDLRHDREVAIKVVRPELTAAIGPERFLREIETTARLTHPSILPLFDSGDADGILWYAMPYFAGRTLKDRLVEHGPLPLAEALGIFRDVAGALEHAHRNGVLHRDLKPANVLLQDGRAVLADFGIALPTAGTATRLTDSGLSVGTPEYMSPEQALGERNLDARSDIYALGCVLYQMLAGEPPFTGATPQAVIAKRLVEPVPRLSTVREVPRAVEAAIAKSLSRQPADRFSSMAEFVRAVDAADAPAGGSPDVRTFARRWLQPRLIASLLLIVVAGVIALRTRRAAPIRYDPQVVAILPARINAPGHSLDYLKEGILDLAAARLTGEGGPRAADPRATLAALRTSGEENAGALAARLGAGKVLDESIVSDGQHLTITATLISYPGGARQAPVSVEGTEDSLGVLVDRLMIRVL
ncbi:MAG: serine/threonine-protein kinase, partial [Gemmatimonadota bacterium]